MTLLVIASFAIAATEGKNESTFIFMSIRLWLYDAVEFMRKNKQNADKKS